MTTTVTDSEPHADNHFNLGGIDQSEIDAALQDNKAKDKAGRKAVAELTKPIAPQLMMGRILAAISGILAIAPYIALINLGAVFYAAGNSSANLDIPAIWINIAILIVTFIGRVTTYVIALAVTHYADNKWRAHIRNLMLARMSRAPLAWFTAINSGRIRKAIQDDATQIHALVAHAPVETTAAMIQPLALLAYAFYIDWRLGLLCIANLPLFVGAYSVMLKSMGERTAEMDTRLAKVSARMVEFVAGISVVKAFGRVGKAHGQYAQAAEEFAAFYLAWCNPLLKGSSLAAASLSTALVLAINLGGGALMVQAGWVTPVEVLATSLIALVVPSALIVVSFMMWAYQLAGGAALRIQATLDTPILPQPSVSTVPTGDHTVRLNDVSFSYGDTQALNGVTLELRPGTVTALIGPSGSGKSTLATLVARFADPDAGSVTIGGVDVRNIANDDLYDLVAFVLQDPQLLHASIRDNILMGRSDATEAEMIEAAKAAYIHDFIMTLPKAYNTIIGEETNLSGGQAQRVSIARALLIDAPILLLDEATAFADPDSEAEIQMALSKLVANRTVLVIAHRLTAILGADQIVVLEGGQVVACGSHEDIKDEPHYQTLLAMNGLA